MALSWQATSAFLPSPQSERVASQLLDAAFSEDPLLLERRWEKPENLSDFLTPLQMHSLHEAMARWKWSGDLLEIANAVLRASSYFGQDPLLMLSIIKIESDGRANAQSSANARGLMQLLPGTGRYIAKNKGVHWQGTEALHREAYNVVLGVGYFDYLMDKVQGDKRLALAAYNWGPGNVERVQNNFARIPGEVKGYVGKVMGVYQQLK
jgi:soluble lytic murein transglycosylase-like protein